MKQLTLFFIMFFAMLFVNAQTGVVVNYYEGSSQTFNITSDGKLFFSDDNLNIKINATSSLTTIPINIIKKITFSNTLSVESIGENIDELTLYPNPSSNTIQFKSNSDEDLFVSIYNVSGQLVLQGIYSANQNIEISKLENGLYLVQANGLTFKFIKE